MNGSSAYPKILHIGDRPIADLFEKDVEITEKVDGSQLGFGKLDGKLIIRSKGKEQELDNPDKMFSNAVEYITSIERQLPNNVFFYGEYLQKPRHSTLAYDRIPKNHIALFGVMYADKTMGDYEDLKKWAFIFDVDTVPLLFAGKTDAEAILKLVEDTVSYLGGQNIEGVVVKRYEDWMFMDRILMPVKAGKYVTDKFKEVNKSDWARLNTSKGGLESLKKSVRTEARWNKAIQHLKESGKFTGTVKDIGMIIKEIHADIVLEEKGNIKDQLWTLYGNDILRTATSGFVDWYKENIVTGAYQDVQGEDNV